MTLREDERAIEDRLLDLDDERLELERDLARIQNKRHESIGQSLGILVRPINPTKN